ncbi:hypothetical protein ACFS07_02480 [Undibacterium arcticum]
MLAGAALTTADIAWVAFAMLMVAGLKIALLIYYANTNGEGVKLAWQIATLKKLLAYSLPFALGNALFLIRILKPINGWSPACSRQRSMRHFPSQLSFCLWRRLSVNQCTTP